jgi:hypothetical protein
MGACLEVSYFIPNISTAHIHLIKKARWAPVPVWTQRLEEKFFCFCRGLNLQRPVILLVARHCTD